jgi:hypothetical protein
MFRYYLVLMESRLVDKRLKVHVIGKDKIPRSCRLWPMKGSDKMYKLYGSGAIKVFTRFAFI